MEVLVPLLPGYREKISSGEELDYKLSKNPGWNDGGKLGCKNNSHKLVKMKVEEVTVI